jgi:hypothetical protein
VGKYRIWEGIPTAKVNALLCYGFGGGIGRDKKGMYNTFIYLCGPVFSLPPSSKPDTKRYGNKYIINRHRYMGYSLVFADAFSKY